MQTGRSQLMFLINHHYRPLYCIHHIGGRKIILNKGGHDLHISVYMPEIFLITGTKVIQTRFTFIRTNKSVSWTFASAGKYDFTL